MLFILANDYYYPTTEVHLYLWAAKDGEYNQIQNNSVVSLGLKTYLSAQITSGKGIVHIENTVTT